jgi:hypothetical protein
MTEKDLVNHNFILKTFVDETLVTAILNEATSDREEPETDMHTLTIDSSDNAAKGLDHAARPFSHATITEMPQVKTPKKSKVGPGTAKRRKTIEDEPLHPDRIATMGSCRFFAPFLGWDVLL